MESEEQQQRRWRLHSIVERHFGRDSDIVAGIIGQKTGAKVSERTVQAWLIQPGRTSSRNCPEWAIKALEEYVEDPANHQQLQAIAARRQASAGALRSFDWSDEIRKSRSVDFATSQLEEQQYKLRVWQDASGQQLGRLLAELERGLWAELNAHAKTLTAIHEAFRTSSTFEEWKAKFQEHVRAGELESFLVRDTKRAIESGSGEFASPDGVLEQPRSEGPRKPESGRT